MTVRLLTALPLVLPLLLLTPSASFADNAADAAACDVLAASSRDFQRPGNVPGVALDDVKGDEAIAACTTALQSNPDDPRILFELGRTYEAANKEVEKQFEFYKRAANKGYVIAFYNLARLLEREGAHKDRVAANTLHCKAAEAGFQLAYVPCGFAHDSGVGFAQDFKVSLNWYQKAADIGDAVALFNLGVMYQDGTGVAKEMERAVSYFKQSAELGDEDAMHSYGYWLIQGNGIKQDIPLGIGYLKKSIAAGDEDASVTLAETYERDKEIPFDATEAGSNFLLGLKRNGKQAKSILIENAGTALKPATLDAIQAQLKAEGKVFAASTGKFTPQIIAVLKDYPAK
jgi:uncharacterized protein